MVKLSAMKKIFYACSGNADLIRTKRFWEQGLNDPNEVSITFSGQILDYCKDSSSSIYMISQNSTNERHVDVDRNITIAHQAKPSISNLGAVGFHLGEFVYGLQLLVKALRFRTDIALIDSGATHYFVLFLFRCFGIKVIPVLHNTLWPAGFPIKRPLPRLIQWLDKQFFRYGANAILCVSNECQKQLLILSGEQIASKVFGFRAQFNEAYFDRINPPPLYNQRPFTILFIGRIKKYKGVFDIVVIAERLNKKYPNRFQWIICGTGADLTELKATVEARNLTTTINIMGWVSLDALIDIYNQCHLSIVPTTSGFKEGLAMTVAESVLAGRPVITSAVVPAIGEMKAACYEAVTNNIDSYVMGIEQISSDHALYEAMRLACLTEGRQFLDRSKGLTALLKQSIEYCCN